MERLTSPNINVDPGTDRFLHATIGGKEIDWKQCRDITLDVLINGPTSNGFGKDIFRKMARDLYGRLKAYEDIAELCGGFDRRRELAEADKDVRVVVPPCKVGDVVYGFHNNKQTILPMVAKWIETNADGWTVAAQYAPMVPEFFQFSDFGKTVFLTHAEAERALQKMEGKP
jgi:hypothetical protein